MSFSFPQIIPPFRLLHLLDGNIRNSLQRFFSNGKEVVFAHAADLFIRIVDIAEIEEVLFLLGIVHYLKKDIARERPSEGTGAGEPYVADVKAREDLL